MYRIKPHLVDIIAVFLFRQLYAPFATVLVCLVFPSWDDALLRKILTTVFKWVRDKVR
jgi:hypothetical protein